MMVQMMKAKCICMIDPLRRYSITNKMMGYCIQGGFRSQLIVVRVNGEGVTRTLDERCVGVGYIPNVDGFTVVARQGHYTSVHVHEVGSCHYSMGPKCAS